MKMSIRTAVAPILLGVLIAGCGSNQQVGSKGDAVTPAAPVAQTAATTTVAPSGTPLSRLNTTGQGHHPMNGPIKMDTKVYDDSVYQPLNCNSGGLWVFDLNRGYTKLTATAGVDDNSPGDSSALTVEIFGDNNAVLGKYDVDLGTTVPIDVNLTNQLHMSVQFKFKGEAVCLHNTYYAPTFALGNASLKAK